MPNIPASVSAVSAPANNLQESRRFIVSLYVIIIIFRVSSKSRYFLFLPTAVSAIASHPILGKFSVFYTIRNPVNRTTY